MTCVGHLGQVLTNFSLLLQPTYLGSLQSARQRGVRGTVRGMRGTPKIKKILKNIYENIKKILKNIYENIKKNIKYQKNAEIVCLVGFFLTRKKKLVSTGFEPMTSRSLAKRLVHLNYENN